MGAVMYPWKPAPMFFRPSFTWPAPSIAPLFEAPLFQPTPVARAAYGPALGLTLTYRSISEWQEMAQSGSLQPDQQLYDPVRGMWQRAVDYPVLRPYFAQPLSWGDLLGLAVGVSLGVLALNEIAKA